MRLKNYDYSQNGSYFITIVTKGRICWLGEIYQNTVKLNKNGEIVQDRFEWLKNQYKYITFDVFIVMPNHVHFVISIDRSSVVEGIKIKPIPELVGAFKTTSSKLIHKAGLVEFKWQRSYHDIIIRNEVEYENIYWYILNNPRNNKNKIY